MKLIVNGDDFGITHACNLAIIDCFNQGVLTSTSIMVNMPYAEDAINLWKKNSNLSIGLHLNITLGLPVSQKTKSILAKNGTFNKNILKCDGNKLCIDEIAEECQAQMDKFINIAGQQPDHINSHHAIECIPGGAQIIQALANRYDLPIRQLANVNAAETMTEMTHYKIPLKRMLKTLSEDIVDMINLFTEQDLNSDDYYELIGHPGYVDYELTQISSLTVGRCFDAQFFCSDEIKNWIKKNSIELINFSDLPRKN